jgi:hypothetical protein
MHQLLELLEGVNERRWNMSKGDTRTGSGSYGFVTKKCPECYAHLPLQTRKCPSCNTKIGDVDKLGFATRPFDWWGYLIAIISIVGLCWFIWWGFLKE